jgi:hypothetical protein
LVIQRVTALGLALTSSLQSFGRALGSFDRLRNVCCLQTGCFAHGGSLILAFLTLLNDSLTQSETITCTLLNDIFFKGLYYSVNFQINDALFCRK